MPKRQDQEERNEIERMHQLMETYSLDGQVRWLGKHIDKHLSGEIYRVIADNHGAFVQPALFEAFGLTVIEAMSSGLPAFVTCFGGPREIIIDGVSGFHIDPNHGNRAAEKMCKFFEQASKDEFYWKTLSDQALKRVNDNYTWSNYASRLMTLSRVYGFWKFVTNLEREETQRYLQMLYALQMRPISNALETVSD